MADLDDEAHDHIVKAEADGDITHSEGDQQFWEQWDAEVEADQTLAKILWEEGTDA